MPTDKEIEEAINWAAREIATTGNEHLKVLRHICFYMKTERDKYKADCELLTIEKQHKQNCYDNLKESARQNDVELNKDIDKYKAMVEADTEVIRPFANYYQRLTNGRRGYPTSGDLWALDSGEPTEVAITIENLKSASDILALREKES